MIVKYSASMGKAGFILLAFAFIILFSANLFSQDLIVTNDNDSIRCKLKGVSGNYMLYDSTSQDGTFASKISLGQMKSFRYGYYRESKGKVPYSGSKEMVSRFRIGINGGFSYRTAPVGDDIYSPSLKKYMESLRWGYNYGVDCAYFFIDYFGIGFRASQFNTGKKETESGTIQDNIKISLIGPELCTRLVSKNHRNSLLAVVTMGYSSYHDDAYYNTPVTFKGGTFGLGMDLGYDIGFSRNWALGFQVSAMLASLMSMDVIQGGDKQHIEFKNGSYESLARIDLSAGLRYRF